MAGESLLRIDLLNQKYNLNETTEIQMCYKSTVAIIGGGAGGMLVATNLILNHAYVDINIINAGSTFATGVAYSSHSENHLLNVVAAKMSVFPSDPDHFVRWVVDQNLIPGMGVDILKKTYLPRGIYGDYLKSVWRESKERKPESMIITELVGRAIDVEMKEKNKFIVQLHNGKKFESDFVVLATGNATPRNPPISNRLFYQSKKYFNNPWNSTYTDNLDHTQDILIIGNGLTMVDAVQLLFESQFKGVVHSISPNGFGILPHSSNGSDYGEHMREIQENMSLHDLVSLLNKHIKRVRKLGLSAEPVVDSLRARTQSIWMSLNLADKKKFMARLRHLWGVARHRLPKPTYDFIQTLKIEQKLKVSSGTILDIIEREDHVLVNFYDKKSKSLKHLIVGRVINCTGPEGDINEMNDTLFKNLISSGMIAPHPLKLGVEADPNSLCNINKDGYKIDYFFSIGGLLRGLLWESTAMPEIRKQAKIVADQISVQSERGLVINPSPIGKQLDTNWPIDQSTTASK